MVERFDPRGQLLQFADALFHSLDHDLVYWFGGWMPRHGVALGIAFDVEPLSAALAAFAAVLATAVFVYGWRYFDEAGTLYIEWDNINHVEARRTFEVGTSEPSGGGVVKRVIKIQEGIPIEAAKEIVKYLKDSFAYLHKAYESITPANILEPISAPWGTEKTTRLAMAVIGVGHPFDHYGQMVEYLRMNSIIPPASRQ